MEYAKDEVFQIRYNTKLNKIGEIQENWTSKMWEKIKAHKLFTTTIAVLSVFTMINIVMIWSFMKILQNI